jgi:hypothetical protein
MAHNTIDYIVSIVIVTTLLTSSIVITTQDLNRAWTYQQDQQTSIEALNILNNLLQNTGNPADWGARNSLPLSFGLRSPNVDYTMPSPFTPMRLMRSSESIFYNDIEYHNLSTSDYSLFLKMNEYLDYDVAAELLAIDSSFGFMVFMKPMLNVSVYEIHSNPLRVGIDVDGLSGTVSGASLNATLFYVITDSPYPSISDPITSDSITNITGGAEMEFTVNSDETKYLFLVKVNLGGTTGIGYYTNSMTISSPLLPVISDYENGIVSLVHRKNVTTSYPYTDIIYYNSTFISKVGRPPYFRSVGISNPSGIVYQDGAKNVSLSIGNSGILLVTSRTTDDTYSISIMPWGITPLCLSLGYGADPLNRRTVVKKSQHASINGISYNIELAFWRLNVEG